MIYFLINYYTIIFIIGKANAVVSHSHAMHFSSFEGRDSMPGLPLQLEFCLLYASSVKASNKETFNIERPGTEIRSAPGFAN